MGGTCFRLGLGFRMVVVNAFSVQGTRILLCIVYEHRLLSGIFMEKSPVADCCL